MVQMSSTFYYVGLGLDSVLPCSGFGVDLFLTPQCHGLVSVLVHSDLGHDLIST